MATGSGTTPAAPLVRFVRDSAADEDFFGSHERVADAIVSVVEATDTHNVIGLLGPWGSGKSTVINLLQRKFANNPAPTLVFTYDAWLHQSDPPRRAFLERFLAFLQAHSLATEDKWQEAMDLLNRRIEESETRTTPTLTTAGYLILLSLLLVPFGSSFVKSDWLKSTATYHWRVAEAWGFPLGVILTSLPILIAILFYYLWRPVRCPFATGFFTWGNWTRHRPPHHDESLLAIIANKQVQRQNNRVVKTPEPTTIEFQRTFRDLLHAAARDNHRLVIVVDNLDRLPDDAALDMWTTIRSFFLGAIPVGEPTEDGPSPPVRLPSVVLPIDDSAIERIFAGKGASGGKSFADSFMEKTFDVTFHVSRPVLSDWNAYLDKQMRFGFGQAIADEWAVEVGRICEKRANGPVTPRDLNRTLNAIASLWMQWQPSGIPFSTVAYYAAMRKAFEGNLMSALASPTIDLAEHDSEWQQSLAAIHFGVPPEKGLQILLEPKLRAAISSCDHRVFGEQVRIKGFERVLYTQLDAQDFAKQSLVHLCQLLDRAGIEAEGWATLTWRRLRRIFTQSDLTETQDNALPAAFDLLIRHCPVGDRERFLRAVGQTLNVPAPQPMIIGRSTDVFRALLARWLDAASKPGISVMPITIDDARVYLDAGALAMVEGRPNPLIRTSAKGDDLVAALMARVTGDQIGDVGIEQAKLALEAGATADSLGKLVEAIRMGLLVDANSQGDGDTALFIIGSLRGDHGFAREALENIGQAGVLAQKTQQALARKDLRPAARLVALSIIAGSSLAEPFETPWGDFLARNPAFAADVDGDLLAYGDDAILHRLVTLAQTNGAARPLVTAIFERRLAQRTLGGLFVETIIKDVSAYLTLLSENDRAQFVAELPDYSGFWEVLPAQDFSDSAIEIFGHLIGADHDVPAVRKRARRLLHATLIDVGVARWEQELRSGGRLLPLAADLQKRMSRSIALRHTAFAALQNLYVDLVGSANRAFAAQWFLGAGLLSAEGRQTLLRGLRDHMLDAGEPADVVGLFYEGGTLLMKNAKFEERSDAAIRHLLFPLLSNVDGLTWMEQHADAVQRWAANAESETRADLARRLGEDPGAGHEIITSLRRSLLIALKLSS